MAREKLFNFIPAHHAIIKLAPVINHVTIQVKLRTMSFSSKLPENRALVGKYLQFYVDKEKNVLGWKVFTEGELSDLRHVNKVIGYSTGTSMLIRTSITIPLKSLKTTTRAYKHLPIEVYKSQDLLEDKKPYYYVTIPKQ